MHFKRLFVAASLCTAAAVSQAMPLVVSFVPTGSGTEINGHGPKSQDGHYTFAFEDGDKQAPSAQPGGYGLAHFANTGHDKGPALPQLIVSAAAGQSLGQQQDFHPPGLSLGHGNGNGHGHGNAPAWSTPTPVPEPGSLALLVLGLTGLLGLRLGRIAR